MSFDQQYFRRQYRARPWRAAGEKPVLDRARVRWLRRRVPRGRVLEIGSGIGSLSRAASRYYEVTALDLDAGVVAEAFRGTEIRGVAGSATDLPVGTGAVDLVLCMDVVEHLPDPDVALSEMFRVLAPGGYLYISTPNPESLGARRKGTGSFIYRDASHCSVLTIETWRQKLSSAGFVESWVGTDTLWDAPYVAWLPKRIQWLLFVGGSQLAWSVAPAFRWRSGENLVWLGQRPR